MNNTQPFRLIAVARNGQRIPVEVQRKRVRNLNLRVRSDGTVALSIPMHTSQACAEAFVQERAEWIAERLRRQEQRRNINGPAADGMIPLWGKMVPVSSVLGDISMATRDNGEANRNSRGRGAGSLGAGRQNVQDRSPDDAKTAGTSRQRSDPSMQDARSHSSDGERAAGASRQPSAPDIETRVDALYKREVAARLREVAAPIEERMGVRASRWSVRHMRTRWGSCTPRTRAIRINAALAAYPPECLACVVTHELAHIVEPRHDAAFYALLERHFPQTREVAALLKHPAREVAERD